MKSDAKEAGEFEFVISVCLTRHATWLESLDGTGAPVVVGAEGLRFSHLSIRVGGIFLYHLRSPEGLKSGANCLSGNFAPEKLVYINSFPILRAAHDKPF